LDALGRVALDPLTVIDRSTHLERSLHKLSAAFSTVFCSAATLKSHMQN
jgi:hypothetical protein